MNLLFWYRSLIQSVGATLVKLIATATSGLVSFTTNVIRPVKVTCKFSPIQEGTGDPSPDNVRPISGWTGCKITHTSENLLPIDSGFPGKIITPSGNTQNHNDFWTSKFFALSPGDYVITSIVNADVVICLFPSNTAMTGMSRTYLGEESLPYHFTVSAQKPYCRISVQHYVITDNPGAILSKFVNVIPLTFTDPSTGDPLTVYGGTVTLNEDGSADLYSDIYCLVCDGSEDEKWQKGDIDNTFYAYEILRGRIYQKPQKMANDHVPLCNEFKWHMTGTYVRANLDELNDNEIAYGRNGYNLNVKTSSYNTLEDFKSFLSENPLVVLWYEAYAKTYHFDNIGQLKSFLGTNNIWHNMNGSITAEYWNKQ